jgi:DNA polymerase-1
MAMNRPIIVDANNWCFIQHHAFGDKLSHDEKLTGILWGFFHQIILIAQKFESNRFIFCWDSRKNLRKIDYPRKVVVRDGQRIIEGYKANRVTNDPDEDTQEVFDQFNMLREELLPEFGFKNILMQTGVEADDIIASLVKNMHLKAAFGGEYERPLVVSTDKDLYQLLDHCDIWRSINKELMTRKLFQEKYTIPPQDWVEVKALAGDTSDNIPGIKGVGEKTAIKYVRGELDTKMWTANGKPTAYARIVSPKGLHTVERNHYLMTLPHPSTKGVELAEGEVFDIDIFLDICNRYGFQSFQTSEALAEWRGRFQM